jgi:hypothetical protein
LNKESGRHNFQIDLGFVLLKRGIKWDWDRKLKKPSWMRQKPIVPRNCKQCYFCLKEITNGIDHRPKKTESNCTVSMLNAGDNELMYE